MEPEIRMSWFAKVQVSGMLCCMVRIVRWAMRSTQFQRGAITKWQKTVIQSVRREPVFRWHTVTVPQCSAVGDLLHLRHKLAYFLAVRGSSVKMTNCFGAGSRPLFDPAPGARGEGRRTSRGRRRTQALALHIIQVLPVLVVLWQVFHQVREAGKGCNAEMRSVQNANLDILTQVHYFSTIFGYSTHLW